MRANDSVELAPNLLSFSINFSSSSAGITVALLSAARLWWKSLLLGWPYKTIACPCFYFYFRCVKFYLKIIYLSAMHLSDMLNIIVLYHRIGISRFSCDNTEHIELVITVSFVLLFFMCYFVLQLISKLNNMWLIFASLFRSFIWLNIWFMYLTIPLVANYSNYGIKSIFSTTWSENTELFYFHCVCNMYRSKKGKFLRSHFTGYF